MSSQQQQQQKQQPEPIAIVGSACRFPGGANSPSELWKLLESPRDVGVEIGPDRFDAKAFYHPDGSHHGTSNVLRSYLLQEDVRVFDAAFFNISPNEADSMDPQQRLLLETVYEALEAGGHTLESLRGSDTAMYAGTMTADYNDTLVRDHNTIPNYFATGTNRAIISNRVSYFFDWHGPSMTIDTACSSSLIALHQAVDVLRAGESRVALACGTQLLLNPEMYIGESKLKMLSPNGVSRMWDADADGYARGEGVAAVVLKRLSDAVADGDHIECLVRGTGANHDGFSNGLTVPNADAQAQLIRQTYARAGLDPENEPRDRPQFFEAHGTGTQAGDPKEAAAISECFGGFADTLYVGSVKTVIGHLEGCAGLAGLLKASAMIQTGFVAPNLHFNRLNPRIEPFYQGLRVPTRLAAWPELAEGVPRRVSVNSFGFGGTNAHAILEQHDDAGSKSHPQRLKNPSPSLTPFVFSAASEASLVAQLQAFSSHLKAHDEIDTSDLAWTLHARRSHLSTKAAFSALTLEQLTTKIDAKLAESSVGLRSNVKPGAARLLGVFTGQGAQWPAMGADLIRSSEYVQERIDHLEQSLATLPASDRPQWSLRAEMLAGNDVSRIGEAALSQPLCTAVQVVLVDLLRAAGVTFAAVVGHSSGEIAAAYAAGFVSAHDAIRIAYYRGFSVSLAGNQTTGQKGAMLAVGASWEEAQELVDSETFKGRLAVAAHNSPASVTLSGDADAILQARESLEQSKKFARLLKVDTAYHSHHMLPCGERYVRLLQECGVRVNRERADTSCTWYSSVTASAEGMQPSDALEGDYWRDNMIHAVMFADAVKNAVAATEQLDLAIEVGPHPALRGPAMQNVSEVRTSPLPYCGVLGRGSNDVEAFSEALGFAWTLVPHLVDFESFERAVSGKQRRQPRLVVGLPSYRWNHGRSHWSESRISRRMRSRKHAHHEILGFLSTDSNSHDLRWLNVLKPKEIRWLDGHQLQGQSVFPAAGYVAMALEASRALAGDRPVEVFELRQLSIPKAITFEDGDNFGVETLVTLTGVEHHADQTATAAFSCYSAPVLSMGSEHDMELTASGTVSLVFGAPDVAALSCTPPEDYNMSAVDPELFYATISKLGYDYSGPFRTLSAAKRKLNHSSVMIDSYTYLDSDVSEYLVHPSLLDVAFQASMLAYSAPGDERLWSLSVPTAIGSIRVNPEVCAALPTSGSKVPVCAVIDGGSGSFLASIDLFSEHGEHGMVQVEDLALQSFAPATAADDRTMFTRTKFDFAVPRGTDVSKVVQPSAYEMELAVACERISYYYLRKWMAELGDYDSANSQPHWVHLLDWINKTLIVAASRGHPTLKKEWSDDTTQDIQALIARFPESIDLKVLEALDQRLPAALRSDTGLESMISNDILADWYSNGLGFRPSNSSLAGMMQQVVHRYPHARILEIGAGTGGTTESILESIGGTLSSYTCTDRSEDSFTGDMGKLRKHSDRVTFAVLDIDKAPEDQGFKPHSYDIVVASNVLTAAASLQTSLGHVRQLLRPGGYLLLAEMTSPAPVRCHSILSSIPGGWLGAIDGRNPSPALTPGGWNTVLRETGFSGVDAHTPETERFTWPMSAMASQAVDERVQFLRRPLTSPSPSPAVYLESLVILGNGTFETARIGGEVAEHLERFCGEVTVLDGLPTEEEAVSLNPASTFLNLVDIDSPIFGDMTDDKMDGLKRMLELSKGIFWITHGGNVDQPYQTASIAFGRSIRQEAMHTGFSHMDVSDLQRNVPKAIAEYLLQQSALDLWGAPLSTLADKEHRDFGLLWSREPEVFLDGGSIKIPRLVMDSDQNARLNSSRRVITKTVPISQTSVAIVSPSSNSPRLVVEQVGRKRGGLSANEPVRVQRSSLKALRIVADTFLFLSIGKDRDGILQVMLSETNSCEVTPDVAVAVPEATAADVDSLLVAVASELLAESVLQLPANSHILIHCSSKDRFLAEALLRRAAAKEVHVTFTCDGQDQQRDSSWIPLDPRASNNAIRKMLLLQKPTLFLDLTAGTMSASTLGRRIAQALPSSCTSIDASAHFRRQASSPALPGEMEALVIRLADAVSLVRILPGTKVQGLVVTLGQLRTLGAEHATSAVDWPLDDRVEVAMHPLDCKPFFSRNKTYLLVGLSGQIGQSLCEWMVSNGAGCVCLTSRRPKVDQRWLDSFDGTGATVKVMALDVLDVDSIERVVKDITETCPPIAGVANGAVVFDDQLFAGMSGDSMRKVLGAKIKGSENLDLVFRNDDLDFFVLFSSAVCVFGNPGQSHYAAANGFLGGLARQRRGRGLAASAVDLGRVTGIGHVEAAGQVVLEQLVKKLGLPPVSETDLRQVIGETILAGFQGAEGREAIPGAVVTTGFRVVGDDEALRGPWFSNPFFSHIVKESKNTASGSDGQDKETMLPVDQRLSMAATKEEAFDVLQESLTAELRVMLQLGEQEVEPNAPLLELGIDSLVAVEVRLWFLKALKVDIPVLRIVGGASLAEICQRALEKLPAELAIGFGTQPDHVKTPAPSPAPAPAPEPIVSSDSNSSSGDTPNSSMPDSPSSPDQLTASTTPSPRGPPRKFTRSERISLPQSRFWFLRHMLQDPTTPNVNFCCRLTGNLRIGDLERAIRIVTNRHEALRTCFVEDESDASEAYQKVLPSSPLRLARKQVASAQDVDAEYARLTAHVFDLEAGDVMQLVLLTLSSTCHYLLINYHHIVMDGASFNVFLSDLETAYSGRSLGAPPRQYPEFSVAQRRALDKGEMQEELRYWQAVFPAGEEPPVLPLLPMARSSSRVAMNGFDSHQVQCHLEPDLVARIKAVSKAERCTPFHLHLAAYKALLFSFAGDDTKDLTIGIADAARNDGDVGRSIGFFLNLLALRFRRQPDQTFADAVVEARNTTYGALESSRLPFDVLLTELNVTRSSLHSPFFQAFLDYRQGIQEQRPWANCQLEFEHVHPGRTAYDVTLDVIEGDSSDTMIMFRVQKSLYDLTAAGLLLETYVHLLDVVTRDASLPLDAYPLFGQKQLTQAVQIGRGRALVSEWPETLPHRIDNVAREKQDSIALVDDTGKSLTYSDMINRIEAISEALLAAGADAGSRVLVYQQPAADWVCSMLAIMRISAVYVPLDLRNPMTRLSAVAKDCEPSAVLADSTTLEDAPQLEAARGRIINVSDLPLAASAHVANRATADSPAAILYTSGSTGTPKGITVTQAGLRNEIEGYTKTWGLGAERVLQQSAFTFNHSSDQMYTGLVNGGIVYMVPAEKRGDPVEIAKMVREHSITYTKATPSEYSLWMQFGGDTLRQATSWRFAFGGGEPLTSTVTQEFANLDLPLLRFFNSYGPTEVSISSHKMEVAYRETDRVKDMGRIPCGYSLPNYYTYIVDEQLRAVPVGIPGEICIGGAGVSLGYLNNEELSSKHFVPNPFATPEDVARGWTRMYRTGDIGHLREDGAMVFHSRMAGDSQVKIRGLRIELSDIESNIISTADGALREAVVTLRDGDPPFLVAHVVFAPHHHVPERERDAFLQGLLGRLPVPQYMVPVVAIALDKFPLSNHSKIDRKAVQEIALPQRVGGATEATELTETMVQLTRVWRDVLGKNLDKLHLELNPWTNFFLVGGNSLLAIRLQVRIRHVFHVAIPLFKMLGFNTLGKMARAIEESDNVDLIDWEQETAPPSIPSFLDDVVSASSETNAKAVLVTGATGFLGKYLLPLLAARPDVDMIHCIAVRDKPRDSTPFTSPKVVYHFGDLSLPLLGLGVDEFRALACQVDVVLHMGALRSFWDNYHVLRPSNVHPTKELVKLAAPRRLPIHYISTAGVLPPDDAASRASAGSASAHVPPTDGADGYVASKWAGERILERSAEALGIPSWVYRLLPASEPQSSRELLDAVLGFVDASGSAPDVSVWKGRVDLIPADQIAQALGESVTATALAGVTAGTTFVHYESPLAIHTSELSAHIEQYRGQQAGLESVPILHWFGRIKALGFSYLLTSQEATVGGGEGDQALQSRR